jgi:hypothetical protein
MTPSSMGEIALISHPDEVVKLRLDGDPFAGPQ